MDAAVLAGAKAGNNDGVALASFHHALGPEVSVDAPVFSVRADGRYAGSVQARSPNAFLSVATIPNFPVQASAVAAIRPRPNDVCLTALETAASGVVKAGSSGVLGSNCRFDVRSTSSPAASFLGSGSVQAQQICVKGATASRNGSTVTGLELSCTMATPYSAEPANPSVGTCHAGNTNQTLSTGGVVPPGTYCGLTVIEGSAATTLSGGVYVLRGAGATPGHFWVKSSGSVIGDGVSIYFADASTLTLEGTGELRLTAPTAGAHQGVLFHEASGLPKSDVRITRSGAGLLRGVINLPSRNLFVASSGSTTTDEVTMVVNKMTVEGSGSWSFKSAPPSVADRLRGYPYLAE